MRCNVSTVPIDTQSKHNTLINTNNADQQRRYLATRRPTVDASTLPPPLQAPLYSNVDNEIHTPKTNSHRPQSAAAAAVAGPFPSLIISGSSKNENDNAPKTNNSIVALGSFAQAQRQFLNPDVDTVAQLTDYLVQTQTGIVAHYYMDVELQSVLAAVAKHVPHYVGIADSLKMGDMAVTMAAAAQPQPQQSMALDASSATTAAPQPTATPLPAAAAVARQIVCLGVDFMAESVAAILSRQGYSHVPVYRADARKIGCSLAESAEHERYQTWLKQESASSASTPSAALHVVYINTSLETKAISNAIVPTIACTSSNVLQTLLTAALQIRPNNNDNNDGTKQHVKILYGPDTYMGENLVTLLTTLADRWSDEQIQSTLHAGHSKQSLRQLRDSIVVFPHGNCVVHHMFGARVVETVRESYPDAYVTAHLEVPGEMFALAMHKSLTDDGVVGSTSDILKFIARKVRQAATLPNTSQQQNQQQRLQFILGTEAGMVTSIVSSVQSILQETGNTNVTAEIVFPVAADAVMVNSNDTTVSLDDKESSVAASMPIVPGVAGGEGCSTAGGCATCPYMKMNNLDSLLHVLDMIKQQQEATLTSTANDKRLLLHLPPDRLAGKTIQERPAIELGTEPIAYMREFNQTKRLPDHLVERVLKNSGLR